MPFTFIHVVINGRIYFFFKAQWYFVVYIYVCVLYIYYIFFIHSSMDQHLDCFHALAIVNDASVNMGVQISLHYPVFIFFGCDRKVELLDHMVVLFLIFGGTSMLFSLVVVLVYILINSVQGFPLHPCQHLFFFVFLVIDIRTGVRWYSIVFLNLISLMISEVELLFMYVLDICIYISSLPIF